MLSLLLPLSGHPQSAPCSLGAPLARDHALTGPRCRALASSCAEMGAGPFGSGKPGWASRLGGGQGREPFSRPHTLLQEPQPHPCSRPWQKLPTWFCPSGHLRVPLEHRRGHGGWAQQTSLPHTRAGARLTLPPALRGPVPSAGPTSPPTSSAPSHTGARAPAPGTDGRSRMCAPTTTSSVTGCRGLRLFSRCHGQRHRRAATACHPHRLSCPRPTRPSLPGGPQRSSGDEQNWPTDHGDESPWFRPREGALGPGSPSLTCRGAVPGTTRPHRWPGTAGPRPGRCRPRSGRRGSRPTPGRPPARGSPSSPAVPGTRPG